MSSNTCATTCSGSIKGWGQSTACNTNLYPGRIDSLIFISCAVNYKIGSIYGSGTQDLLVQATLQSLSDQCLIRKTVCLLGTKAKGTLNTKDYGSCGKIPTSGLQTIEFSSPYTEDAAYDVWNEIRLNPAKWQVAAVLANGDILPFLPLSSADIDSVLADGNADNLGQTDFQGTLTVLTKNIWKPLRTTALTLDTGGNLVDFLGTQMNNDINCGGGGTPVVPGSPFIVDIEDVGGYPGNTAIDTEANLIAASPMSISMTVYKQANCVGNVVATIGTIVRTNPNTGVTTNVVVSGSPTVTFVNAPSTSSTLTLDINVTAGVSAGETYSIPISFVGATGCVLTVYKQVLVVVI